MQHRLASVLAFALLTSACGGAGDTTLDITFDPCEPLVLVPKADTSSAERAGIADAIALWSRVLDNRMTLEEQEGGQRLPISFEKAGSMFYGVYEDEQGEIFVNRGLTDPHDRAVVVAHELGHAFGLWHIEDRVSVMNPANLELEPNDEDAADIVAIWGACGDRARTLALPPAKAAGFTGPLPR